MFPCPANNKGSNCFLFLFLRKELKISIGAVFFFVCVCVFFFFFNGELNDDITVEIIRS